MYQKTQLYGNSIECVTSWQYLAVTVKSHTSFNCCIDEKVKSFYRCANGRSSEPVMLQLLEAHCFFMLTYAFTLQIVVNEDTSG